MLQIFNMDMLKLQNYWEIKDGVRDRIEHYNFYQNKYTSI